MNLNRRMKEIIVFFGVLLALLICCDGNRQSLFIKRITSELREITNEGLSLEVPFNFSNIDEAGIRLSPVKDNLLEWHFSFTGVEGTPYEGGVYHGMIKLHSDYPRKAPSICLLTQSGRWEVNKDICLSASQYHPETWNPNWNLRTLVLSLRVFMTTQPREIGSVSATPMVQKVLAQQSADYYCRACGVQHSVLLGHKSASSSSTTGTNSKPLNIYRNSRLLSRRKASKQKSRNNMKLAPLADNASPAPEVLRKLVGFMRSYWGFA